MAHDPKNCELCKKQGLPILLTRYAVATKEGFDPNRWYNDVSYNKRAPVSVIGEEGALPKALQDSKAPTVALNNASYYKKGVLTPKMGAGVNAFHVDDNGALACDTADYTLRLLRSGYLYVYNPNHKSKPWRGFVVTSNAFLLPFDIGKNGPAAIHPKYQEEDKTKPFEPCQWSTSPELGRVITLDFEPSEEPLKPVYLAFSDVQWTKEVWKKHNVNVEGYRDRNMRKFDLQKWVDTAQGDHSVVIDELDENVTDFNEGLNREAFQFSNEILPAEHTLRGKDLIDSVKNLCKKLDYNGKPIKGAIVALDDPAGIVSDLNSLAEFRVNAFGGRKYFAAKNEIRFAYKSLYDAVTTEAELNEEKGMKKAKERQEEYLDSLNLSGGSFTQETGEDGTNYICIRPRELTEAEQEIWREKGVPKPKELEDAKKEAWEKYEDKIDMATFQDFVVQADSVTREFMKAEVIPLIQTYVWWMEKSPRLRDYLICNFDTEELDSGYAYTLLISYLVSSSPNWPECSALFEKWANGEDVADKTNYLLRAMLFNHDKIADIFKEGIGALNQLNGATFQETVSDEESTENYQVDKATSFDQVKSELGKIRAKTYANITGEDAAKRYDAIWGYLIATLNAPKEFLNDGGAGMTIIRGGNINNTPLGRLTAGIVKPLIKHLNNTASLGRFTPTIVALGAANRTPAINLTIVGTPEEIIKLLATEIKVGAGDNKKIARHIQKKFNVLKGENAELRSNELKRVNLYTLVAGDYFEARKKAKDYLDKLKAKGVCGRAYKQEQLKIAKALINKLFYPATNLDSVPITLDLDEIEKLSGVGIEQKAIAEYEAKQLDKVRQRRIIDKKIKRIKFVRNTNALLTPVGVAVEYYALYTTLNSVLALNEKSTTSQKAEAWSKFSGAVLGSAGVTISGTMNALAKAALAQKYANIRPLVSKYEASWIKGFTKKAGLLGAAVGGIWDLIGAAESFEKGQYVMAGGYVASGAIGIYSAILIWAGASNPVGWVLLFVSFGLGYLLTTIRDDPYQEWLGNTIFGKDLTDPGHEVVMASLRRLLGEEDENGNQIKKPDPVSLGEAAYEELRWDPASRQTCIDASSPD